MSESNSNHETARHPLGIAGLMAKSFIHSPLSPLLLLAFLGMGIMGLIFTPRQEDPQISVPMADIFVNYPGADAEQVSSLVAAPLERIMSEIPGVDHVYSASERDHAVVTVQFKVGQKMESSLVKLYDKLSSHMDLAPPGASQPLVKPKGADDVPILTLSFSSDEADDSTLRLVALDVLQAVSEMPEVNHGFVVGGRPEQLRVEVLPERLAGFGITLDQLASTLRAANSAKGVGSAELQDRSFKVYTGSFLRTATDVENLMIGIFSGAPVYVRDVAQVIQGPGETHEDVRIWGKKGEGVPAVTLAIAKKAGTNGVDVANGVLQRLDEMKGRLIPDNVHVDVTRNYGESARTKVNDLLFKLFIATLVVTLLVWFFLGWRAGAVVLIVIPVVILVTVFMAWIMGYTIDRVSLFALIFSIGILVDDAIVVVENIYRRWLEKGDVDTDTSVDAVAEVGNPTILATFTVIAALMPMGFVSGMMGPYMEPIPALGSVAMIFSLFAAFVFTPWLAMKIRPSLANLHVAARKEHRESERLDRFYRWLLLPMVVEKVKGWGFLIGIIFAFALSMLLFYTAAVPVKMLPFDNKPEFAVVINMPEGTALPQTANLAATLARELRQIPEIQGIQSYAGSASPFNFNGLVRHYYLRQQPWQGDLQIQLVDKHQRKRSSHQIAAAARELLTPLAQQAGARIAVVEMPPGPPVLEAVVAEVYGPDADTRREVAHHLTDVFEQAGHITDVDNLMQQDYEVWRFAVDDEKALHLGVSVDAVNRTLEMAMGGFVLGDVKRGSVLEPTMIVLQLPLDARAEFARLGEIPVPASGGGTVPLAELGRFVPDSQGPIIYHKDLRALEYVVGDTIGRLGAPIYGMLEVDGMLKDYITPDGQTLSGQYIGRPDSMFKSSFAWTGEWTVTYETFRDMGIAFGIALILIYMLVVWQFGNFLLPAIVMAPIPLTLIGIVPGHWLLGADFTATSMIGFIALAGIIVRNSILLVDFSRQETERGTPVVESLIMACKTRTRPILITALALMAGSSVILFDPIFQGMAISLMFGVLVSTLLTLVVIPLGCISGRQAFCPATIDIHGLRHSICEDDSTDEAQKAREYDFVELVRNRYERARAWVQRRTLRRERDARAVAVSTKESPATAPVQEHGNDAVTLPNAETEPTVRGEGGVTSAQPVQVDIAPEATRMPAAQVSASDSSALTRVAPAPANKSKPHGRRGIRIKQEPTDE
jgi:multidrug efflux pump subunit AcrB